MTETITLPDGATITQSSRLKSLNATKKYPSNILKPHTITYDTPSGVAVVEVDPVYAPPSSGPTPNAPVTVGKLIFDDEFQSAEQWGTSWANDWFSPSGNMNNVRTDPANVAVSGGQLTLARSAQFVGALVSTNPSGGARPGFQFTYGYVEARITFASNQDWCAWWTNGQNWPADGEIDIVEILGGSFTSNYHATNVTNNGGDVPGNWGTGPHTYGVNRQPRKNDIYWDGQPIRSYSTSDGGSPHYLILNVGSGSAEGVQMTVDYVRVWNPG